MELSKMDLASRHRESASAAAAKHSAVGRAQVETC